MNKAFQFKQFAVAQDRCAMKIGTDSILFGAWVSLETDPPSVLDIGAGTGIIALALAQRSNAELIDAIEIDVDAYEQCVANFENSPWGDRLFCYHAALDEFVAEIDDQYDLIVSNPPYYAPPLSSETSQDNQGNISDSRKLARFYDALPFQELIESASKLLDKEGVFAVIIPRKEEEDFIAMASEFHLFPKRICRVRGNESAAEKRSMLEFSFKETPTNIENLTIEISRHHYTEAYIQLVKDFYLKM